MRLAALGCITPYLSNYTEIKKKINQLSLLPEKINSARPEPPEIHSTIEAAAL